MAPGPHVPTVENWSDAEQQLVVTSRPGYLWNVLLRGKIQASPADVYSILTDEHPERIFKGIKAVTHRRVIEQDKRTGRRTLEVCHRACTKFLFISVAFDTHLRVEEDPVNRTIHFKTCRDGFMKRFDGRWTVQPFTQDTLDDVYKDHSAHHHQMLHNMGSFVKACKWHAAQLRPTTIPRLPFLGAVFQPAPHVSLVSLEQSIEPQKRPPAAINAMVCKLCAKQVQNLMADLRSQVAKRQATDKTTDLRSGKTPAPVSAASLTLAMTRPGLESFCSPINITIHL